jgi:hypothetical protein
MEAANASMRSDRNRESDARQSVAINLTLQVHLNELRDTRHHSTKSAL